MDNLIFSLNATMPIFITMLLGMLFKKVKLFDDATVSKLNKFVFQAAIPVVLFLDLATEDFYEVWDTKFVLFCFFATLLSVIINALLSLTLKDKSVQGEFIQAGYRSSCALLGVAFITNIYGNAGMAPLMIIGSVPLYNVMAVLVLSFFNPKHHGLDKSIVKNSIMGIFKNPIIIGVALGLVWSLLRIPMPKILSKTLSNISCLATPLGLMAMGASFNLKSALKGIKPVMLAVFMKLVGLAAIFLPIAIALGFRESTLASLLIMLGSPTTVTCFIMAKNMGHEGSFTSSAVMLTTLLSAFTMTMWLYILKSLGTL